MRSNGRRGGRCVVVVIGALLAAVGLVSTASAEESLLTRASTGPRGGNGDFDARFSGASADGTRIFFLTKERLVRGADTDSAWDVYRRSGTHTRLISTGPTGGNGPVDAEYMGASADGTRVFFGTYESLVSADADTEGDVYERAGGQTTLISTGPTGGNGPNHSHFAGASADGSRVFFETRESLVSADTDPGRWDVYERAGAETTLISTGPTGGNGPNHSHFAGASADGSRVFFATRAGRW